MRGSTIVILIDALGFAIARSRGFHPPALPERARLRTVLGFSQAALASIFTGLMPNRHGLWMMYSFAREAFPFGWLAAVPRGVSSRRLWLRRMIRWHLSAFGKVRGYYSLYDIPLPVLRHLDIPARGDIFAPGGAGESRSVLDALAAGGAPGIVWDYRTSEERAFDELEEAVRGRRAAFYLLYTAGLDAALHREGTGGAGIGERLAWYSERIARVADAARADGAHVVVLGDHGMCDVRSSSDVMEQVDSLGLGIPRDYVPFYDSTMARFKVNSTRSREALAALLRDQPSGHLLSRDEMEALGVAFADGRFGDLVFLADPGVLILPSFMGGERVAAMHGYHPDEEGMYSAMFSNRALPSPELSLVDVASIILPGFAPARGKGSA